MSTRLMARLALVLAFGALVSFPAGAAAQDTIRIGCPTKTYFPTILAIVAKEKGLFEKEGLRPEITIYRGGGETFEAIAANSADLGTVAVPLVATSRKRGVLVKIVGGSGDEWSGWILGVKTASPIKSPKEIVALARQKPGELTFASSGIGGAPHLTGEFFALTTGIKMTHVAYKGGGPAIADLLAGSVTMSFASMTSSLPFIKAGRLRPLAVSSKDRSAQLPDVPTMAEAGIPNIVVRDWQGILAPRGTPQPIVDKLAQEIGRILRHADNQERLAAMGLEVIASTPAEFRAAIAQEVQRWAKVVKDANIRSE